MAIILSKKVKMTIGALTFAVTLVNSPAYAFCINFNNKSTTAVTIKAYDMSDAAMWYSLSSKRIDAKTWGRMCPDSDYDEVKLWASEIYGINGITIQRTESRPYIRILPGSQGLLGYAQAEDTITMR